MARSRQLIGLLTLLTLIVIAVSVTGLDIQLPRPGSGGPQAPQLQGVKPVAAVPLVKVGSSAPAGAELAFMAVEPSGNLVVSDSKRASVMRFDPAGQLLSEWGPVLGTTQLVEPAGVAVAGDNYYVVDRGTPRIMRLDSSGQPQAVLDLTGLSTYGLNGLAVDPNGNLYVADTGRNRILVFTSGGQLLKQIGHSGSDLGGFTQPMMLAFGPDGSFVVADWENGRLERFTADYQPSDAWTTGFRAFGVAVDPTGRVFAPDFEHGVVEVYSPQGGPLGDIGSSGAPILDVSPKQIAIAAGGQSLYVLDSDAIERVDLTNTPPPPPQSVGADFLGIALILLMAALVVVAVLSRRRRSAALLGAPPDRPIWLHAKNGTKREHQQADADEDLLIANQSKSER
jgi:DNA-binding beta-propeller fold protein YncE